MSFLEIKKKNRRPTELNSSATRCSFLFGRVSCAARNGDFSCSANTLACLLCACACARVWRMLRKLRKSFQRHRQMKILEPKTSCSERSAQNVCTQGHIRTGFKNCDNSVTTQSRNTTACSASPWSCWALACLGATSLVLGSCLQQLTPPGSDRLTENASQAHR